jgi:hypothetical protein
MIWWLRLQRINFFWFFFFTCTSSLLAGRSEQLEVHDINTSTDDELYMMPYTSSWYEDYKGTLLYKNINQNFVLTTEVTVTNRAGNGLPSSIFSSAGLMIRSGIDYHTAENSIEFQNNFEIELGATFTAEIAICD